MPQPYTETAEKEEITPKEYAQGKDVGSTYTPDEYVTSGSAPQTYPADESASQSQQRGKGANEDDHRRGYYNRDDASNWSSTTTGHAPQTYPTYRNQSYNASSYAEGAQQPRYGRYNQGRGHLSQRQTRPNVDQTERQLAVAAGGALLLHALLSRSRTSLLTGTLGAALVWHGQSQRSPIYEALDVNTARQPLWGDSNGLGDTNDWQRHQGWQGGQREQRRERPQSRQAPTHRNTIEIERAVTINKPAQELYTYWRKLENLPNFMEHLQTVEQSDDKHSHWVARLAGGLPVAWDAEIVEDKPNERIAWRTLPDAQVQQSGVVTFKSATGERGTVVNVDLKYSPPGGIVGETFARLLNGITAQQVKDDIRRFKSLMETGEIPTVEGQSSGRA